MAFAFVAARGVQIVGTSGAVTASGATGAGNPLILAVAWNPNTRTLLGGTDTQGNTWQLGGNKTALNRSTGFLYCNPTTPLGVTDVVTPTFSSGPSSTVAMLFEFSGGRVQRDGAATNSGAAGTDATTNVTVTNATNFGVLALGSASAVAGNFAADIGWTRDSGVTHSTVNLSLDFYYKIGQASGVITDVRTLGVDWATAAADFIAALSVMGIGEMLPMTGAQ